MRSELRGGARKTVVIANQILEQYPLAYRPAPGIAAGHHPGDQPEGHAGDERQLGGIGDPPAPVVDQPGPGEARRRLGGQPGGEGPEERKERQGQRRAGGAAAGDLGLGPEGGEGQVGAEAGSAGQRIEVAGDGHGGDHPDQRRQGEQGPEEDGGSSWNYSDRR